jgi:hypothetical protein
MDVAVLSHSSGIKNNYDANANLPGFTISAVEPNITAVRTKIDIFVIRASDIT